MPSVVPLGPVKLFPLAQQETSTMDSGYYRNPVMQQSLETTTPAEKGSLIVSQDANNITYYLQWNFPGTTPSCTATMPPVNS